MGELTLFAYWKLRQLDLNPTVLLAHVLGDNWGGSGTKRG